MVEGSESIDDRYPNTTPPLVKVSDYRRHVRIFLFSFRKLDINLLRISHEYTVYQI